MAMDEAGDSDEEACQRYLGRARSLLAEKPFRLDPGERLGAPDDRRGVRFDQKPTSPLDAVPDAPVDGG